MSSSYLVPVEKATGWLESRTPIRITLIEAHAKKSKDLFADGMNFFKHYQCGKNANSFGLMVYLNRRAKQFCIFADSGLLKTHPQTYWDAVGERFCEDLRSTHPHNAVAMLIYDVGSRYLAEQKKSD